MMNKRIQKEINYKIKKQDCLANLNCFSFFPEGKGKKVNNEAEIN